MNDTGWVHGYAVTLSAPRATVFAALTEADQLRRWFADQVEVDATPGGPWRCWGRRTLGAPDQPHPGDVLRILEVPAQLGFSWMLEGCPTEVTLALTDHDLGGTMGTRVAVRHEVAGSLPHPRPRELVDDFWRLALGNLAAHLAGGEGIVRPDFADPHPEIRVSIQVGAPPEAVFHALMNPDALRQWVGATAPVVDPRVGGAYRYGWQYPVDGRDVAGGPRTILALEPSRLLVTDWPDWRGDPAVPVQQIEWHLAPEGSGTRVTVVHAGFTRAADFSDYPFGWAVFARQLKGFVEGHGE